MIDTEKTLLQMVEDTPNDKLQSIVDEITPAIAGEHDPDHAAVRSVLVDAAERGLIEPVDELLVNAIKDGGRAASGALEILRSRMAATIHFLAAKSGIDYAESDAGIFEGIWEAAIRFNDGIAKERKASYRTYAYPWMRKRSKPRAETRPGRLDKPFKCVFSAFCAEVGGAELLQHDDMITLETPSIGLDVRDALATLGDVEREIVTLRFLEGRTIAYVSKETGVSEWVVRTTSLKALETLREALPGYEEGWGCRG